MADAIILAIAGGQELLSKTQKKYFAKMQSKITRVCSFSTENQKGTYVYKYISDSTVDDVAFLSFRLVSKRMGQRLNLHNGLEIKVHSWLYCIIEQRKG